MRKASFIFLFFVLALFFFLSFRFFSIPQVKDFLVPIASSLVREPLEEPTGYYEKDTSRTWPLGASQHAQSRFDRDVAADIRNGGYILVFRHAHREKVIDVTMYDALELISQTDGSRQIYKRAVCLSETEGKMQAWSIGEFFTLSNIPIGSVISSPSCRSRQTAMLAFKKIDRIEPRLLHFYGEPYGPFDSDNVKVHFSEIKQILLGVGPQKNKNTIISAHNNTIRHFNIDGVIDPQAIDLKHFDFSLEEGGFHVLKIVDGKLLYVTKFRNFAGFSNKMFDRPNTYSSRVLEPDLFSK